MVKREISDPYDAEVSAARRQRCDGYTTVSHDEVAQEDNVEEGNHYLYQLKYYIFI